MGVALFVKCRVGIEHLTHDTGADCLDRVQTANYRLWCTRPELCRAADRQARALRGILTRIIHEGSS